MNRTQTNERNLAISGALLLILGVAAIFGTSNPAYGNNGPDIKQVEYSLSGQAFTQTDSASEVIENETSAVDVTAITIHENGFKKVLKPQHNSAAVINVGINDQAEGISVIQNVILTNRADAGFVTELAEANTTTDLRNFVKYNQLSIAAETWGSDFDLIYDQPLKASDYLAIISYSADAPLWLTALDSTGNPIGPEATKSITMYNAWNTGFASPTIDGNAASIKVIPVSALAVDGSDSITGIKVENNTEADFKILPLAVAEQSELPKPDLTEIKDSAALSFTKSVYAGHNSGANCSESAEKLDAVAGEPITYCFDVINTGKTDLTEMTLDDPVYSVDGFLTTAGNDFVLEVSEKAQYYVEVKANDESFFAESTIKAKIADQSGQVIQDLEELSLVARTLVNIDLEAEQAETTEPEIISETFNKDSEVAGVSDESDPMFNEGHVETEKPKPQAAISVTEPEVSASISKAEASDELAFTGPREVIISLTLATGFILLGLALFRSNKKSKLVPKMVRVSEVKKH